MRVFGDSHLRWLQEILEGEAAMHVHGFKHFGHHAAAQLMVRLQYKVYTWGFYVSLQDVLPLHALQVDLVLTHQLCAASSHRTLAALTEVPVKQRFIKREGRGTLRMASRNSSTSSMPLRSVSMA